MKFIMVVLIMLLATSSYGERRNLSCEFEEHSNLNELINKLNDNIELNEDEGFLLASNAAYFIFKLSYEVKDPFEIKRIIYNYYNVEHPEDVNLEHHLPYEGMEYYANFCGFGEFRTTMMYGAIEYTSRYCARKVSYNCSFSVLKK